MKYHQYLFSFSSANGSTAVTVGLEAQQVTQAAIDKARAAAGALRDMPLIAVSYLGYMTMAEFNGQ